MFNPEIHVFFHTTNSDNSKSTKKRQNFFCKKLAQVLGIFKATIFFMMKQYIIVIENPVSLPLVELTHLNSFFFYNLTESFYVQSWEDLHNLVSGKKEL